MVQWLGLCAFAAKSMVSIPSQQTKIPQVKTVKKKKKADCKLYIDFLLDGRSVPQIPVLLKGQLYLGKIY